MGPGGDPRLEARAEQGGSGEGQGRFRGARRARPFPRPAAELSRAELSRAGLDRAEPGGSRRQRGRARVCAGREALEGGERYEAKGVLKNKEPRRLGWTDGEIGMDG